MLPGAGAPTRHLVETVAKGEEGIERNQALILEYRAHFGGHFLAHALAFRGILRGTGQQLNQFALGEDRVCRSRSALPFLSEAWPASNRWGSESTEAKGAIACCQDWLRSAVLDFSLTSKNLPDAQVGLKHAHRVSAQAVVGDTVDGVGHLHKTLDRSVVEIRKF